MNNLANRIIATILLCLAALTVQAQEQRIGGIGFMAAYMTDEVKSQVAGMKSSERIVWMHQNQSQLDFANFDVRMTLYKTDEAGEEEYNRHWRQTYPGGMKMWSDEDAPLFADMSKEGTMLCARIWSGGLKPIMPKQENNAQAHPDGSFSICTELHDETYRNEPSGVNKKGAAFKYGIPILLEVPAAPKKKED